MRALSRLNREIEIVKLLLNDGEIVAPYPSTLTPESIIWAEVTGAQGADLDRSVKVCEMAALQEDGTQTSYEIYAVYERRWLFEIRVSGTAKWFNENITQIPRLRWAGLAAAIDQVLIEDAKGRQGLQTKTEKPVWQSDSPEGFLERLERGIVSYGSIEVSPEAFETAKDLEAWLYKELGVGPDSFRVHHFDSESYVHSLVQKDLPDYAKIQKIFYDRDDEEFMQFYNGAFEIDITEHFNELTTPDSRWFGPWYYHDAAEIGISRDHEELVSVAAVAALPLDSMKPFFRTEEWPRPAEQKDRVQPLTPSFYVFEIVGFEYALPFPNTGSMLHVCFDNDGQTLHVQVDELETEIRYLKLEDHFARSWGKWLDEDWVPSKQELDRELKKTLEILDRYDLRKG